MPCRRYTAGSRRAAFPSERVRAGPLYVRPMIMSNQSTRVQGRNLPYRQGPIGMKILCQPTSVKVSIALSQVGLISEESILPPLFFIALYAAKNTRVVQENPGVPCSAYASGTWCSSYSCMSPSPSNTTPPGRKAWANSSRSWGKSRI